MDRLDLHQPHQSSSSPPSSQAELNDGSCSQAYSSSLSRNASTSADAGGAPGSLHVEASAVEIDEAATASAASAGGVEGGGGRIGQEDDDGEEEDDGGDVFVEGFQGQDVGLCLGPERARSNPLMDFDAGVFRTGRHSRMYSADNVVHPGGFELGSQEAVVGSLSSSLTSAVRPPRHHIGGISSVGVSSGGGGGLSSFGGGSGGGSSRPFVGSSGSSGPFGGSSAEPAASDDQAAGINASQLFDPSFEIVPPGDASGGGGEGHVEPSRTLFVRNVPTDITDEEVHAMFQAYGDLRNVYTACRQRGYVMVAFFDLRSATLAYTMLQGATLRDSPMDIIYAAPIAATSQESALQLGTIVVFNMDPEASNSHLGWLFSKYGEVKDIREAPSRRSQKFVTFYDTRHALAAFRAMNCAEQLGKLPGQWTPAQAAAVHSPPPPPHLPPQLTQLEFTHTPGSQLNPPPQQQQQQQQQQAQQPQPQHGASTQQLLRAAASQQQQQQHPALAARAVAGPSALSQEAAGSDAPSGHVERQIDGPSWDALCSPPQRGAAPARHSLRLSSHSTGGTSSSAPEHSGAATAAGGGRSSGSGHPLADVAAAATGMVSPLTPYASGSSGGSSSVPSRGAQVTRGCSVSSVADYHVPFKLDEPHAHSQAEIDANRGMQVSDSASSFGTVYAAGMQAAAIAAGRGGLYPFAAHQQRQNPTSPQQLPFLRGGSGAGGAGPALQLQQQQHQQQQLLMMQQPSHSQQHQQQKQQQQQHLSRALPAAHQPTAVAAGGTGGQYAYPMQIYQQQQQQHQRLQYGSSSRLSDSSTSGSLPVTASLDNIYAAAATAQLEMQVQQLVAAHPGLSVLDATNLVLSYSLGGSDPQQQQQQQQQQQPVSLQPQRGWSAPQQAADHSAALAALHLHHSLGHTGAASLGTSGGDGGGGSSSFFGGAAGGQQAALRDALYRRQQQQQQQMEYQDHQLALLQAQLAGAGIDGSSGGELQQLQLLQQAAAEAAGLSSSQRGSLSSSALSFLPHGAAAQLLQQAAMGGMQGAMGLGGREASLAAQQLAGWQALRNAGGGGRVGSGGAFDMQGRGAGGRAGRRGQDPHADAERRAAQEKLYTLDAVRILGGEDKRTTLMIKNIPNKYTQKMLLTTIDDSFRGTYDFFYLPIDFKNKCNVGYAFINLIRPEYIVPLVERFHAKKWERFNSEKICHISYARIQGRAALVSHFQNSSLMHEDKRCRPILFASDGSEAGEQEAFPTPSGSTGSGGSGAGPLASSLEHGSF